MEEYKVLHITVFGKDIIEKELNEYHKNGYEFFKKLEISKNHFLIFKKIKNFETLNDCEIV